MTDLIHSLRKRAEAFRSTIPGPATYPDLLEEAAKEIEELQKLSSLHRDNYLKCAEQRDKLLAEKGSKR